MKDVMGINILVSIRGLKSIEKTVITVLHSGLWFKRNDEVERLYS